MRDLWRTFWLQRRYEEVWYIREYLFQSLNLFHYRHSLKMHHKGITHDCHCGAVYKNKYDLTNHQREHTDKKFSCEICRKQFLKPATLKYHWIQNHEQTHGKMVIKKSKCLMLWLGLNYIRYLSTDIVLNKKGLFTCDKCGSITSSRASFLLHIHRHMNQPRWNLKQHSPSTWK